MSNILTLDLSTIRPAVRVDRLKSFIILPEIVVVNIPAGPVIGDAWSASRISADSDRITVDSTLLTADVTAVTSGGGDSSEGTGASRILAQYNYSAPNNFTLIGSIEPSAYYLACIKFRKGREVFRYKLWSPEGAILPEPELYTNQIILKNFSIEIFNLPALQLNITVPAKTIYTSVTKWPTGWSLRNRTDYELASGASAGNLNASGWDGTQFQIDPAGIVTTFESGMQWLDNP